MKYPRLVLLSFAAIALIAGCGKSNTPTSSVTENTLDTSAPSAPEQVSLSVDPASAGGVLVWSPSSAADVARYEVYEYTPSPVRDNSYIAVFASEDQVTRWALPPVSVPTLKWYRVAAIDVNGNRSALTPAHSFQVMPVGLTDPQGPSRLPFEG